MPSIVETSRYLSIIACALAICKFTEMLVNLPVFDLDVLITAPMPLKAFSTRSALSATVGTINLYKYSVGQDVMLSLSSLRSLL